MEDDVDVWRYAIVRVARQKRRRRSKVWALCNGDVLLFVRLFVCRQRVLMVAGAYRVGHLGHTGLLIPSL